LINLDIDSLRTFVTLADNKSFTLTAERVARTQSTVSAQIKKLEDRLGFVVFERNRRSFSVTPRGETLLGYAREVLRLHDDAVHQIIHGTVGGTIRLGITDYFVPHALPELLMRFRALYPDARVEVTSGVTGELLAKKKATELDIVIGRRDAVGVAAESKTRAAASKRSVQPLVLRREKIVLGLRSRAKRSQAIHQRHHRRARRCAAGVVARGLRRAGASHQGARSSAPRLVRGLLRTKCVVAANGDCRGRGHRRINRKRDE
jgi:DNA-binding transcriptional LysR family regulator